MYQVSILENFSILKNLKINFHKIFKGTIRKLYFLLILMSLKNKVQEFILWRRWLLFICPLLSCIYMQIADNH